MQRSMGPEPHHPPGNATATGRPAGHFDSIGVGAEDGAVALQLIEHARAIGVGRDVDL